MIEPLNSGVAARPPHAPAQPAILAMRTPPTGDVASEPFELPAAKAAAPGEAAPHKDFKLFGADGFDVFDVIDIVNPLQHIPVISTIYRRLTGDELSPGARIIGATLLGGPIGAALAMADSAVEYETGKDTGANVYAALFGNEGPIPAADVFVAARQAAPWQDPDLMPDAIADNGAAPVQAYVAAATPDLGALADFTTGAGGRVTLEAAPAPSPALATAPTQVAAAAWKNPDLEPLDAPSLALLAQMNQDTLAIENEAHDIAVASAAETAAPKIEAPAATAMAAAAPAPTPIQVPVNAERPMPSDAAKAQAINALAAMPTSQTSAAVAELARTDPRPEMRSGARHQMVQPAGDIPRGAAASLNRKAASAYANSTASAKPTKAEVAAAADEHNANAIAALERSTSDAQNDWMLDAMQRAMAKYEASARLKNAGSQGDDVPAGGISMTR